VGLNQFQKTLDANNESKFEIDHGSVTTVVTIRESRPDLVEIVFNKVDNLPTGGLQFTPYKMYMAADELESLGQFLYSQGSSLRIQKRESFVEDIYIGIKEEKEKQNNLFEIDNDHINLTRENLYRDVIDSNSIKQKMRSSKNYCERFYATLCNNVFTKNNQEDSYSWRSSGGFVADVLGQGDYLNWYCAGNEGHVDEEVIADLNQLGWSVIEDYYDNQDYMINTQMKLDGENDEQK
jgi:hypothetical protein